MSDRSARVSIREITAFMNAVRAHRNAVFAGGVARSDLGLLAWKASILERIADSSGDADTRAAAERARVELAAATDTAAGGGH